MMEEGREKRTKKNRKRTRERGKEEKKKREGEDRLEWLASPPGP